MSPRQIDPHNYAISTFETPCRTPAQKMALTLSPIRLAFDKALSRAIKDRGVLHPRHWTGQGAPMQSAQQQDVDPAEVGIGAKYRDSLFGYQRMAKEIIASIEE